MSFVNGPHFKPVSFEQKLFKVVCALSFCLFCLLLTGCFAAEKSEEAPNLFGIYTANLDGTNMKRIVSDSWRELTHNRVSPDHKWITFTRYNNRQKNGLATEEGGGYDNTEVLIARIDGSEVRSVVPPHKGAIAANSYWTPDGKGLIYLAFDEKTRPEIKFVYFNEEMRVEKTRTLPLPDNLFPSDPSQVGNKVVFPAKELKTGLLGTWLVNLDGSDLRQVTVLKDPVTQKPIKSKEAMEVDPKLSPDGSKVAFMRLVPHRFLWHTFVADTDSGKEKDLSNSFCGKWDMDGVPEWSSDGKLLIVWHPNLLTNESIFYTMQPDGSARHKVALPQIEGDYYYVVKAAAFFPGTGSGPDAKIIFNAKHIPISKLKDSPATQLLKHVMRFFF